MSGVRSYRIPLDRLDETEAGKPDKIIKLCDHHANEGAVKFSEDGTVLYGFCGLPQYNGYMFYAENLTDYGEWCEDPRHWNHPRTD